MVPVHHQNPLRGAHTRLQDTTDISPANITPSPTLLSYYSVIFNKLRECIVNSKYEKQSLTFIQYEITNLLKIIAQQLLIDHSFIEQINVIINNTVPRNTRALSKKLTIILPYTKMQTLITSKFFEVNNKQIFVLTNTIIHEFVHVLQNILQYQNGKNTIEYRSYAGSYYDLVYELKTKKYNILYYSSPQEIDAFSYNFAITLLSKMPSNNIPKNVSCLIQNILISYIGKHIYDKLSIKVKHRYFKKIIKHIQRV